MIGSSLFRLSAIACTFLALYASTIAATKNVDIVVTHNSGSLLTTYTVKETSGKNQPAGMVYIAGQAFRRGDLPPGTYPVFRDATTHVPLIQQLDEIATRRENGDDGSIRHLVFAVQLPAISANGTYTMEVVRQTGTYSAAGKQSLAALANAHDLKLHLTDVRNQDDTVRGSGSLTFDINTAALNTGRDAPRRCAAGPVRDCWIVVGPPIDDVTHQADPLLYVTCYLDLTTGASDQTSLGAVRHVCRVDNSWMNVAAGSSGNAGNPGPAGFANDPQAISYRPAMLDGNTVVLDWSGLDATVSSSSNPVQTTGCGTDYQGAIPACLNLPRSTGANAWYFGQATRVTSTGTPVGGLTNGGLYYVYNNGSTNSGGANTTLVSFQSTPILISGPEVLTPSQGAGTTNFSYRLMHTHWMSWFTLDASGLENWTAGSTGRATSPFLVQMTAAEKTYWEETGTVIPMNLGQTGMNVNVSWGSGGDLNYHPLGRLNVIGGTQAGPRADIGIINEFAAQAFIRGTPDDWAKARLFTLGTSHYQYGSLMNEATGRIPAINNGPPNGPGGNGVGGSYPQLASPHSDAQIGGNAVASSGVAAPLEGIPVANVAYGGGFWGEGLGYYISHEPSFSGLTYLVFGSRHYLELMYLHGNRSYYFEGMGPSDGQRDNVLNGNHYYGLFINCCQRRGGFWAMRDKILPAGLGGDDNPERAYFNDYLVENNNYYAQWLNYKDGGSTNFHTGLLTPNSGNRGDDTFVDNYGVTTSYLGWTMLHDPLSQNWLTRWANLYEGTCGETAPGHLSAYYCIEYIYESAIHDGGHPLCGANVGQYFNGTDASDYASFVSWATMTAGSGQIGQKPVAWTMTVGDQVKNVNIAYSCDTSVPIDQLDPTRWYNVVGPIDNNAGTFYIENPATPGVAFPGFTRNGVPIDDNTIALAVRPQYAPPTDYFSYNYKGYGGEIINALKVLGYNVNSAYDISIARGLNSSYNSATAPSQWWDIHLVVP